MIAVIAAGGRGTRLASATKNIPKSLVKIGKKPIIERQIILLKRYGIKNIWVLLGYLGEQIERYLGNGRRWGVNIQYSRAEEPMGRTGDLKEIEGKLKEDFLFLSGDIMMDFDIERFIRWHRQKKDSVASIVAHPSDHPFDSDLIQTDETDRVASLLLKPHNPSLNFQNLGIASVFIFSPKVFDYIAKGKKSDFEKDILPLILKSGRSMYACKTPEYIKDMGTPERLKKVRKDYNSGVIEKFNLRNKRKAIFLDRDGVINKYVSHLARAKDFELYSFAKKAVKKINDSEYLAIIITNQPMVAKGFLSENDLCEIHKKMETELGKEGAKIDAIYHCPHHPEKGFLNEVAKLKIKCSCRKPKVGLIKKAARDFNIDLGKSFFIGDSSTDAKTAENAKVKFLGVKTGYGLNDNRYKINKNFPIYRDLLEAVQTILKK